MAAMQNLRVSKKEIQRASSGKPLPLPRLYFVLHCVHSFPVTSFNSSPPKIKSHISCYASLTWSLSLHSDQVKTVEVGMLAAWFVPNCCLGSSFARSCIQKVEEVERTLPV